MKANGTAVLRRALSSSAPLQKSRYASSWKRPQPLEEVETYLKNYWNDTATKASTKAAAYKSVLQSRLSNLSWEISKLSGYERIEELKARVEANENLVLLARAKSAKAKEEHTAAVEARAASQRESNDLLSRKNSWTSADVSRFTELVKQDHMNEQNQKDTKLALDRAEEDVDRGFSELLRGILARYHEEQVWSDKIRSLSTYGTIGITGINVLVFLLALIVVEPWRRRKLVEKIEARMHERHEETTNQSDTLLTTILQQLANLEQSRFLAEPSPIESQDAQISAAGQSLEGASLELDALATLVSVDDESGNPESATHVEVIYAVDDSEQQRLRKLFSSVACFTAGMVITAIAAAFRT